MEFVIPNQDKIASISVCKISDGEVLLYEIKLNANGVTLASLEPFEVPGFASLSRNVQAAAIFDLNAFLNEGNPFQTGQNLNVVNGMVPQTSSIEFRDDSAAGSGDPQALAMQLLDDAYVNSLPLLSGPVRVVGPDTYAPVPEPAAVTSLVLGLACVAMWVRCRGHRPAGTGPIE